MEQRPLQDHGLEDPGHMGQRLKIFDEIMYIFGCSQPILPSSFLEFERRGRASQLLLYFTLLSTWMEVQCDHVTQVMCAHHHLGQDRKAPLSLSASCSVEGLPRFSLPKGLCPSPKTQQPCPILPHPPTYFPQFLLSHTALLVQEKGGSLPIAPTHAAWSGGGRKESASPQDLDYSFYHWQKAQASPLVTRQTHWIQKICPGGQERKGDCWWW